MNAADSPTRRPTVATLDARLAQLETSVAELDSRLDTVRGSSARQAKHIVELREAQGNTDDRLVTMASRLAMLAGTVARLDRPGPLKRALNWILRGPQ